LKGEIQMSTTTVQTIDTRIGKLGFELGVPTSETAVKLYDEMDFQRAVQCYLWGLPTVGMEELKQGVQQDTGVRWRHGDCKGWNLGVILTQPGHAASWRRLTSRNRLVIDYRRACSGAIDWWDRYHRLRY
jgi:hypothetical protein